MVTPVTAGDKFQEDDDLIYAGEYLDMAGYWKYTAIDSLTNADPPLPAEERTKIVTSIVESKDTVEVLLQQ